MYSLRDSLLGRHKAAGGENYPYAPSFHVLDNATCQYFTLTGDSTGQTTLMISWILV